MNILWTSHVGASKHEQTLGRGGRRGEREGGEDGRGRLRLFSTQLRMGINRARSRSLSPSLPPSKLGRDSESHNSQVCPKIAPKLSTREINKLSIRDFILLLLLSSACPSACRSPGRFQQTTGPCPCLPGRLRAPSVRPNKVSRSARQIFFMQLCLRLLRGASLATRAGGRRRRAERAHSFSGEGRGSQ